MKREEIVKVLQGLVEEQTGVPLEEKSSFAEAGMDSLDRLELCVAVERQFSIVFKGPKEENVDSISELADVVSRKLK